MQLRLLAKSPDAVVGGLLFFGFVLFYVSFQRGRAPTYDAGIYIDVARNLAEHLSVHVRNDAYAPLNSPYASYGLGLSLMIVPLVFVQKWVQPGGQEIVLLANVFVIASTAVLVYFVALALKFSRLGAVCSALVFGVTTMALQQATDLFSEPGIALFAVLTVFGLVKWRSGSAFGPWLVGCGIALAITFRSDSMVLSAVVLVAVPLFVPLNTLRQRKAQWLVGVCLPIAGAMVYQLAYNHLRYGKFTQFGYRSEGFTTPFLTGLYGNTFSPGKGFFIYSPFLILGIPGLVLMWRRDRAVVSVILLLGLTRILFYARWHSWPGGVAWGPRFMFPLCALLAIPSVETVRYVTSRGRRSRVIGLVGASVLFVAGAAVAVLGVMFPFERWWQIMNGSAADPQSAATTAQRMHDYTWTFGGSPIAGNLRLLRHAEPTALLWFSHGRLLLGVTILLGGLLLLGAATVLARRVEVS